MFSNPNLPFTLFLHFTILITHQALSITTTQCHIDDENGLLAFKSGIIFDPSGMLNSWKPNTDCCKWDSVECSPDPNNKRVTGLYIYGRAPEGINILSGQISASLSRLKYLNSLLLKDLGNLTGPFPEFLFTLPNLSTISIPNSKLYGRIPKSIGNMTNLLTLDLSGNQFSGSMPSSLAKLARLRELYLSDNRLSGRVPLSFKRLKNLFVLNLSRNQFTGTIPDIFKEPMTILRFSNNKFTGKIPQSLLSVRAIVIDFGNNELTGEIPEFGWAFDWIRELNLSRNQFSGSVPEWYGTLSKISILDLSHNKLNGSFPEMNGVNTLDLSYNNFRFGSIPKWIGNTYMENLGMAKCGIKIKLNDWIPIANYKNIDLSENEITGNPLQLLNSKVSLEGFYASKNKLKFDMKHMKVGKNLKLLDLSNNMVFGIVPKAVSRLKELNVSYNHLCGKLPATKFLESAFLGNDCLCGAPLPPCKV
ncbi:hypothetical protein RD792_013693 [Penstemon davidsonii]|uniref:non-specific serine/threonine protein kinase n=1 Tax=Penstemon davidsonii TaxID=160366 RepID=A0ABR0CU84_9LAMI|nr:hypothetical protein RD792_013693 [Penstemon davidsonii]